LNAAFCWVLVSCGWTDLLGEGNICNKICCYRSEFLHQCLSFVELHLNVNGKDASRDGVDTAATAATAGRPESHLHPVEMKLSDLQSENDVLLPDGIHRHGTRLENLTNENDVSPVRHLCSTNVCTCATWRHSSLQRHLRVSLQLLQAPRLLLVLVRAMPQWPTPVVSESPAQIMLARNCVVKQGADRRMNFGRQSG
jgi:hypothetical protein